MLAQLQKVFKYIWKCRKMERSQKDKDASFQDSVGDALFTLTGYSLLFLYLSFSGDSWPMETAYVDALALCLFTELYLCQGWGEWSHQELTVLNNWVPGTHFSWSALVCSHSSAANLQVRLCIIPHCWGSYGSCLCFCLLSCVYKCQLPQNVALSLDTFSKTSVSLSPFF